jgi:hypothetical protein
MELVLEDFHGVEHGIGPVANAGVQAAARDEQQREAVSGLLIADPDITFLVERPGSCLPKLSTCDFRAGRHIRKVVDTVPPPETPMEDQMANATWQRSEIATK